MLTTQEIKTFIDNDAASKKKQYARLGQRYYEADHDIRHSRFFYIDANGQYLIDTTRSNIKISHPFYTELVDQAAQYMLSGKDGFVKSDIPELQGELDAYFNDNEDFAAELYEVLTGCMAKGMEYAYAYKNKDGRTAFQCADSIGVVEVKAKETDDGCEYVIFWYVDRIGKDNKQIKRIQVWDSKQIHFFVQEEEGKIIPDEAQEINPRPHAIYNRSGDKHTYFEDFGFIPFFRLDNNRKQIADLKAIKDLIDDYDLMACGLSNNIEDANEVLYVVKGFEGDNLDELMTNIKAKKHIGVTDGGDVEIRTVDIPYQARQTKLELDEKNIYRFGFGFNSAQLGDGNITNVVIKSRYALLDLKCNKLEIRLKQFMRKLLKVVLDEINAEQGTDYQQKDVYFDFEREVMTNAADNAQIDLLDAQRRNMEINTIKMLQTEIDDEMRLRLIAEQLDVDYDELAAHAPKEDPNAPYTAMRVLAQTPTEETPAEGDVIE